MIRFIDLGDQIIVGHRFAFYDTVTDKFLTVGQDQVWDSIEDLEECWACYSNWTQEDYERLLRLIPKDWGK